MEKTQETPRWTLETALAWMRDNGNTIVGGSVILSSGSGLTALGCGDFLHKKYAIRIVYPEPRKEA